MNKFRKLGFITYNGTIEVHNSPRSVVLYDDPHAWRRTSSSSEAETRRRISRLQPNFLKRLASKSLADEIGHLESGLDLGFERGLPPRARRRAVHCGADEGVRHDDDAVLVAEDDATGPTATLADDDGKPDAARPFRPASRASGRRRTRQSDGADPGDIADIAIGDEGDHAAALHHAEQGDRRDGGVPERVGGR